MNEYNEEKSSNNTLFTNQFQLRYGKENRYDDWFGINIELPENIFEIKDYRIISLYLDKVFSVFRETLLQKYLGKDYYKKYVIEVRKND